MMASSLPASLIRTTDREISREELLRRLDDPSLRIVDVLPKAAYASGHIVRAISLPLAELTERAPDVLPGRTAEIAVYCASFT